jgi:hypothetical protein
MLFGYPAFKAPASCLRRDNALADYAAVIIAADNLGATGGASPDVFMRAVTRASEICIGIASAGTILAVTDFDGAQRRLAVSGASSHSNR